MGDKYNVSYDCFAEGTRKEDVQRRMDEKRAEESKKPVSAREQYRDLGWLGWDGIFGRMVGAEGDL